MADIPQFVLSERLQEVMQGWRLHSAVFTTFRFEPDFFETEILPVLLDVSLSHVHDVKLALLDDALRQIPGHIAVYYDQTGLDTSKTGARLDIARIPVRLKNGACFHPKNIFMLAERASDGGAAPQRALFCICLSANLTMAGWWRNVEVAHVEILTEGARTRLHTPLLECLGELLRHSTPSTNRATETIAAFLRDHTSQSRQRSRDGRFLTHLHHGTTSVPTFVSGIAGKELNKWNIEIISPYFDGEAKSLPLEALIRRFSPHEVRVFLPRGDAEEGLCRDTFYDAVAALPGVTWARLPVALERKTVGATRRRFVHAKVYRFFEHKRGGRQILYVGSANLTQAGCGVDTSTGKGRHVSNWESGFLVELEPRGKPDWWLQPDTAGRPMAFQEMLETDGTRTADESRLQIAHSWSTHTSRVCWNGDSASPPLVLRNPRGARDSLLASIPTVAGDEWVVLDADAGLAIERSLATSSLIEVSAGAELGALVLVQEEDLAQRPSMLYQMSPAEILRYWALLTPAQRAAETEARALAVAGIDDPEAPVVNVPIGIGTLFDRHAGIFHAFHCLERSVRRSLEAGLTRDVDYRLFGRKYDSLGSLVEKVCAAFDRREGDSIEHYLTLLCARQLLDQVSTLQAARAPMYWNDCVEAMTDLRAQIGRLREVRAAIEQAAVACGDVAMADFLDWFEPLFVRRAAALTTEDAP